MTAAALPPARLAAVAARFRRCADHDRAAIAEGLCPLCGGPLDPAARPAARPGGLLLHPCYRPARQVMRLCRPCGWWWHTCGGDVPAENRRAYWVALGGERPEDACLGCGRQAWMVLMDWPYVGGPPAG